MVKQVKGTSAKMKALVYAEDKVGKLLWNIFAPVLVYSAELMNVIADDIVSIDNAMKWGFGWKQGPFEVWDAIGVEQSVNKMKEQGLAVPTWIEEMLAKGITSFYKEESDGMYFYDSSDYKK